MKLISVKNIFQAEKEEQAAKEQVTNKDYLAVQGTDTGALPTETSWSTEVLDPNAPPTQNWADDVPVSAPAAAAPDAAAAAPAAFPASNDWGSVSETFKIFSLLIGSNVKKSNQLQITIFLLI